jgi:alpha-L-rhamnosidase
VRWSRDGDRLAVDVVVPVGTTARIELPDSPTVEVGPGRHRFDRRHRPAELDPPRPARREPQLAELDDQDAAAAAVSG